MNKITASIFFILLLAGFSGTIYSAGITNDSLSTNMSPGGSLAPSNTVIQTNSFTEGIWIHKYPKNYTCFRFQTPSGVIIITDPYNINTAVSPDIVTISHHHGDHKSFTNIINTNMVLDVVGEYTYKGIKITGLEGRHYRISSGIDTDTMNNIYVFDVEGIRIAQFASQGEKPTKAMFDKIGRIDILIIQISSDVTKMTLDECEEVVTAIGTKIIIPAHGDPPLSVPFSKQIGGSLVKIPLGDIIITRKYIDSLKKPEVLVLDN